MVLCVLDFVSLSHIVAVTSQYSCMLALRIKIQNTAISMEILSVFLSGTNCNFLEVPGLLFCCFLLVFVVVLSLLRPITVKARKNLSHC